MDAAAALIRRATPDDAEAAALMYTASRRSASAALPPAVHTPQEDAWFVREVLIAARETWVAARGEELLGLLTLDGDWIDQLYLAGSATRQGLGSRFVDLAKTQRPSGLQLWTFASNLPAQRFYERHGFIAVERTDGEHNEEHAPDIRYRWN